MGGCAAKNRYIYELDVGKFILLLILGDITAFIASKFIDRNSSSLTLVFN